VGERSKAGGPSRSTVAGAYLTGMLADDLLKKSSVSTSTCNGIKAAIVVCLTVATIGSATVWGQSGAQGAGLTALQAAIERQRTRLSSSDSNERRDAITRLGAMKRPDSSRAALACLRDPDESVRAAAVHAVAAVPSDEAAQAIIPLLKDKSEFVRREAAYALGKTRSRIAVSPLVESLQTDKEAGVRGAAVVALGFIGDHSASGALADVLAGRAVGPKRKREKDEFVLRSAARSLGQLREVTAVPVLVETLADEKAPADVRREAAHALGLIGDPSSVSALRAVLGSSDPYLSRIAEAALKQIVPGQAAKRL
jgi:HEAT repeat protein